MNFLKLLNGAEYIARAGRSAIAGLDYDSRRVKPEWCFVAIKGETTDGNLYIRRGARGRRRRHCERFVAAGPGVSWAQVPNGRRALARLSANFYHRPAEKLKITGITGTNGKTTTSFILHRMLQAAKRKTMLVGTVEYRIGDEIFPSPHTTPEALELNQFFASALNAGCTEAVMEVSSHALEQGRVMEFPSTSRCLPISRATTSTITGRWRTTSRPRRSCSKDRELSRRAPRS